MIRSKFSTKVVLLAAGIGLSAFAGSQPAAAQYTCPAGTIYDPTYGCTLSGADDFGYCDYPGGRLVVPSRGQRCRASGLRPPYPKDLLQNPDTRTEGVAARQAKLARSSR